MLQTRFITQLQKLDVVFLCILTNAITYSSLITYIKYYSKYSLTLARQQDHTHPDTRTHEKKLHRILTVLHLSNHF